VRDTPGTSREAFPTDLVGKIYMSVDFDDLDATTAAIHGWLRDDLVLGPCSRRPV
jgi:hypothetical protein